MKTTLPVFLTQTESFTRSIRLVAGGILLAGLALGLARAPIGLAGAGLLAGLVIAAVILAPAAGLALIALAIPYGRMVALPLPGIGIVDGLVALTLLAWLLRGFSARRVIFHPPPLMWPLLAFVWVAGLSLTQAGSWREGVTEWLKWGEFAALYLVAAQILGRQSHRLIIGALLLAGVGQVAIGAYQFVGQVGPEAFILSGRFMRAYGTFQQPNPYAGYLGYLAPVAVSLALAAGGRWRASRRPADLASAIAYASTGAALGAGILMSWSRGAWLGLATVLTILVGLRKQRTAAAMLSGLLLLLLLAAVIGAGWLPDSLTARIEGLGDYIVITDSARTEITDSNFSVLERLAHWQAGLQMFAGHPWLGVGIGNYAVAYPAYAPPHWYIPLGHAHNIFINTLAETGALGLAAFGVFWLGVGYWTWRRSRGRGSQSALALGILGTWIYLTVHNMFDNLFVQHMQLQLALLLGIISGENPQAEPARLRTHCIAT